MSEIAEEYTCVNGIVGITFIMNARPCHFLVVNGKKTVICSLLLNKSTGLCLIVAIILRLETF